MYGPIAQGWLAADPEWAVWAADYGLMAVQVFLVVAGFLAAQTMSYRKALHPLLFISRRFERLARPMWFVLLLTVVLTALARPWLEGDMLPDPPRFGQLLAHVFMLQGALGYESLSAGMWYTAIDFQLYVIMVWLVLVARQTNRTWLWPTSVAFMAMSSAVWVNLHSEWDASGFYFFGSYGVGALVFWAQANRWGRWLYLATLSGVMLSVWMDWRLRLAVAVSTSLFLWCGLRWQGMGPRWNAFFARLNDSTYLFFLLNFPSLIVANLLWVALGGGFNLSAVWFVTGTWFFTLLSADFLQRRLRWLSGVKH